MVYALSKDMHISYTEFNEMPFFEILMIIDVHNEFVEKQEKESNSETGEDIISRQQADAADVQPAAGSDAEVRCSEV